MEMKSFLGDDFLLNSRTAVRLYHEVAALQPIIDYHNHLPPREITQNRRFTNLSEAWLEGDHYKWRAMRTAAVPERLCTGSASPREKFSAWAAVVPQTLGNPLYHWTHLELRRYFGIGDLLSPTTAEAIWERANAVLAETSHGARGLLAMMNVQTLCTTDDPAGDLAHHIAHQKAGSPQVDMRPAFRPDKTHDFRSIDAWNAYIERLGDSAGAGAGLRGWEDLLEVLMQRHAFFHQTGCRLSDHGVEFVPGLPWTPEAADAVMKKALSGSAPAPAEILLFRSAVMESCARMDAAAGWTMQIHMGALRNVNPRRLADLGPDTGFDVIGDFPQAAGLVRHLGALAEDEALPRTILYNLNPADNEVIASIIGAFAGEIPGKVQFGSGWWFNDQKDGMIRQITALANLGLLSRFVGMLTDSRSFLSFPRHEYFRRILCNTLGTWAEAGEIPNHPELLNPLIENICYRNARDYFGFKSQDTP